MYLPVILPVKAARKRNTFLRANVKIFARKRNGNARKRNAPVHVMPNKDNLFLCCLFSNLLSTPN